MISPPARNFLNSSFVNVTEPARHRGRAGARDARRRRRRARHRRRRRWCASSTSAAATAARRVVSARARPGVVNGLGVWWRKLGVRRHERQRADAPAADRHRPRAELLRLPGRGRGRLSRRPRARPTDAVRRATLLMAGLGGIAAVRDRGGGAGLPDRRAAARSATTRSRWAATSTWCDARGRCPSGSPTAPTSPAAEANARAERSACATSPSASCS